MSKSQSSPNLTSRSKALAAAASSLIRSGERVVDLGAGREAVLCRVLLENRPDCHLIAVEPMVEVEAPPAIETIKGDISALPEASVDVILFNSPNTPDSFLNPEDGSYFQFAGGPNGYECLHEILRTAPPYLRSGGRLLFICPTFTLLPDIAPDSLEVVSHYFESIDELIARAPVEDERKPEYLAFLVERQQRQQQFWEKLGVPLQPNHITAVVLSQLKP